MPGPPASRLAVPDRPLLLYDGDCSFCLRWVVRARAVTEDRVDYAPAGAVPPDPRVHDVAADEFRRSVFLFEPGGRVSRAAEAACRTLAHAPRRRWRLPLLLFRRLPGAAPLAEAAYRFVAAHREGLLRVERLLVGDVLQPGWRRSRALFRRGLALVALIAFVSLWVQIDGLSGSRGIVPAAEQLGQIADRYGRLAVGLCPTLLWLGAGDAALHGLCAAGTALSLLLLLDVAPALCAFLLWLAYLSLFGACEPFLSFQWDTLLLETLLLAAWVLPWRLRPRWPSRRSRATAGAGVADDEPAPSPLARALLWWLLFRFMFESGVVKLTSGDDAWTDLTALTHHYMTQPLPHVVGWLAWQLPEAFHRASAAGMFAIELLVPFTILAPRRVRHAGCALLVALQLLIAGTGNYGFFNLLTIVLCLALLDDEALAALSRAGASLRRRRGVDERPAPGASVACGVAGAHGELPDVQPVRREGALKRRLLAAFAAAVLVLSAAQVHDLFGESRRASWDQLQAGVLSTLAQDGPADALAVLRTRAQPLASVNAYGLFRVMTRTRPEILVQGSADGEHWVDYEFRWKPGDPARRPGWAQPHMPRLDWQLWFEALDWEPYCQPLQPRPASRWFVQFLERLQAGEPAVISLLARDPFDGRPPAAVRAALFDYRFTTSAERAATGAWWTRQQIYPWVPLSRP